MNSNNPKLLLMIRFAYTVDLLDKSIFLGGKQQFFITYIFKMIDLSDCTHTYEIVTHLIIYFFNNIIQC